MRRSILILLLMVCGWMSLMTMARPTQPYYTDDAYYWPVVDTMIPTEPVYDKDMRELVFVVDTAQYADTISMPSR